MNRGSGGASVHHALRLPDLVVALALPLVALYLGLSTPAWGAYDPVPRGWLPAVIYLVLAALPAAVLLAATRSRRGPVRWLARVAVYPVVLLGVAMVVNRVELVRRHERSADPFPPRLDRIRAVVIDSLEPLERATYGARIAAHLALDGGQFTAAIELPRDWPFPTDVMLALDRVGMDELDVWAQASDGTAACFTVRQTLPAGGDLARARKRCGSQHRAPDMLSFQPPVRVDVRGAPPPSLAMPGRPWGQYRGDETRGGRQVGTPDSGESATAWQANINGQVRSTVAIAGDAVLVGAHGAGSLSALELRTGTVRWIARLPNWIHQDPISDGRVVFAGFGDKDQSFLGRSPSGAAAYDLATGRRLWTAFDSGSVMTTGVIRDSVVVYGTAAGFLRKRRLDTGELLGGTLLPGSVTMAPPAASGDTVVFALDHGTACALLISTLETIWCHVEPHWWRLGHSAPSIANGQVIVSGGLTAGGMSLHEFRHTGRRLQRDLVRSVFFPRTWVVFGGQVFAALDLRDGHVRWRSTLFGDPRRVRGHNSGTATLGDSIGVIVLPMADTVVAFVPATGQTLWTSHARDARGPVLMTADRVVWGGRDGVIEVRELRTGSLTCTVHRDTGWDRAGPALAGGLAVFADLDGRVEAIPIRQLLDCTAPGARSPGPEASASGG